MEEKSPQELQAEGNCAGIVELMYRYDVSTLGELFDRLGIKFQDEGEGET